MATESIFDFRRRSFKDIARAVIALRREIPALETVVDEYAVLSPEKVSQEAVKAAIEVHVNEMLANAPLRLFNTYDGKLYSREELRAAFQASAQYDALLLLTTSQLILQQTGYIREVVRSYFQYAMLSHRWENQEPLFRDIQPALQPSVPPNIYRMTGPSGITKLQNFCHAARARGFRWAWSDTCCIDKSSSADLQQSIASMFTWYRNSGLTIVYLSDVVNSSPEEFLRSAWFLRGWTLQELLAPHVVQFYMKNWAPFVDGPHFNHKEVGTVLDLLETATGVDRESLVRFVPGVQEARARLGWASKRRTTEEEDAAYSLMGIFDLHMPIIYGEKEKAFGRLLTEILGRSDDITLFNWVGLRASIFNSCLPAHPDGFSVDALVPTRSSEKQFSEVLSELNASSARAVYNIFTKAHPIKPSFTHGRLAISCIAYKIKKLRARYDPHRTSASYQFDIFPQGLEPLCIATAETLDEVGDGAASDSVYALARVWDDDPPMSMENIPDVESFIRTGLWHRLAQPFFALLLVQPHGVGPWRRVPTVTSIITSVKQLQDIQDTPNIATLQIT